ncbi:MAG: glycosyltransferase family 4 protein [Acidimicrobiia bacterium]
MRVLVNATRSEADRIGGDFTFVRTVLDLDAAGLDIVPVPESTERSVSERVARLAWRASTSCLPRALRRSAFRAARRLPISRAALDVTAPDVVFSHLSFPRLPRDANVPIVWSSQGISPARYYRITSGGRLRLADVVQLYRTLGPRASALLVWTETEARLLCELVPTLANRVTVVHPPVDIADEPIDKPSRQNGTVRLLFVGTRAIAKGLPEAVEAFQLLRGRHARVEMDVVTRAPGWLSPTLHETTGLTTNEIAPGLAVQLMRNADVLVFPSYDDTYGLVAAEAMANGCAVVAFDAEPLPEVVPDGEAGLIVRTGGTDALADALDRLVSDEALLRRLQAGAWRRCRQRNHPRAFGEQFTAILEQAVAQQ